MSKTNKMSLGQLTLVTAVNMIGAGIIMLPSQLAQVGAVSVFAWIISTVGAMSLAYAFAKCGLYSKKQGGLGCQRFRQSRVLSQIPYQGYFQRNTDGCTDLPYPGPDGYGADDDFSIAE